MMIQPFIPFDDLQKLSPEQLEVCNIYATMVTWARAFFSEKAHYPHDEKEDDYAKKLNKSESTLATIATMYRSLYVQFCNRYAILNPTENYLTAIQHMDGIARWLKAKQQGCDLVTVRHCVGDNCYGEWRTLTNQQMHEKIMKLYAGYRMKIKLKQEKEKTNKRGSAVNDWEPQD